MGTGIVSLVLCLFAGFPFCCLLFEPVTIKEHYVHGRNKRVLIWIHFDWSLFTTDAWKDLQKYIFSQNLVFLFFLPRKAFKLFVHCTSSSFSLLFCLISLQSFPSCPTAPARRLCLTASASPPSSARTHRPLSTTPPGCSSSRSGSGPASLLSSKPLKSSPQSVPLISFISPSILHLYFISDSSLLLSSLSSTFCFPPIFTPFFLSLSPCPHFGPFIFGKVWAAQLPASLCVFVYGSSCVLRLCDTPSSNFTWRLMEDFWSNLLEYWLWEILIKQYISPRQGDRYHGTRVGSCNGG